MNKMKPIEAYWHNTEDGPKYDLGAFMNDIVDEIEEIKTRLKKLEEVEIRD